MTEAIIFDCWETLFTNSVTPSPFEEFAKRIGRDLSDPEYELALRRNLMVKKADTLRGSITCLLNDLKIEPEPTLIDELECIRERGLSTIVPFPEVFEELASLRKEYKLALLTNTEPKGHTWLKQKYAIDARFDVIVTSYECGLAKPMPPIFRLTLTELGVSEKEAVMVGDSMELDIRGAEDSRIPAVLMDRKNKYPDYPRRITSLTELRKFL